MERIETELEIFKQQTQKRGSDAKTGSHRIDHGILDPIVYTRTRSVEVSLSILRENRVLTVFGEDPLAHTYRVLSVQVLHRMVEKGWNVLGVTSPGKGEGKTLTAVNLAISLAIDSHFTVLLVDGNLHDPGIHQVFGLKPDKGLADYLINDTPIEDLLVHPGIRRFTLLPGGQRVVNPVELLGSPKMCTLASQLKNRYVSRIILYDLPCLHHAADVLALSSCIDAILIVAESGRTRIEDVELASRLLKGIPIIGTVLNKDR